MKNWHFNWDHIRPAHRGNGPRPPVTPGQSWRMAVLPRGPWGGKRLVWENTEFKGSIWRQRHTIEITAS